MITRQVSIQDYLNNIMASQHAASVSFEVGGGRVVQVREAKSLLALYNSVHPRMRAELERTLRRSSCHFNRITQFAQERF